MQHITTLQWIQFCYLASQTCDLFLHEDDTSNQNYTNPGKENNHGDHQPPFSRLFLARALLHYGRCRYQLIAVTLGFFSECSTKKGVFRFYKISVLRLLLNGPREAEGLCFTKSGRETKYVWFWTKYQFTGIQPEDLVFILA